MPQRVQIAGLEPSNPGAETFFAVQIRGIDSEGNPGLWSRELIFQSLEDIPADLEDIIDTETIDISENDILIYDGEKWVGSDILFDGTFALSDDVFDGRFALSDEVFDGRFALSDEVFDGRFALSEDVFDGRFALTDDVMGPDFYRFEIGEIVSDNGSAVIDFESEPMLISNISEDTVYTTDNLSPGKVIKVLIKSTGLNNLTFPDWLFFNSPPPSQIGDEDALLILHCFGESDGDCAAQISIAL